MTREEARKIIKAKLECLKNETSGINDDCNMRLCDGCPLNYEQGNMGEQKEALELAIKALEQQPRARDCKICIHSYPTDIDVENEIKRALHENLKELDKAALEGNRRDEDAISRQAVLEKAIIIQIAKVVTEDKVICRKVVFVEDIQKLPSVTPQQRVGKWIQTKDDCDGVNFYDFSFECSKCGREQSFKSNYCPNCGAKMEVTDGK